MDAEIDMELPLNSDRDSQLPLSSYHGTRHGSIRGSMGASNITASFYIGKVLLGGVPKMFIIVSIYLLL